MKKAKKSLIYAITSLLILGIASSLFMGCGSKSNATSANKSVTSNKAVNSAAMKKKMEDSMSSLVTAGTITKDQESKILAALTSSTRNFGGNRSGNRNTQGSQNGTQNKTSNNNGNSNGQGPRGNRQFANPLGKLVTDGTITQAQADAVMAKVRTNTKHTNGN